MIEVREITGLIAIDKETSISYYTFEEAEEIRKRLNEIFQKK